MDARGSALTCSTRQITWWGRVINKCALDVLDWTIDDAPVTELERLSSYGTWFCPFVWRHLSNGLSTSRPSAFKFQYCWLNFAAMNSEINDEFDKKPLQGGGSPTELSRGQNTSPCYSQYYTLNIVAIWWATCTGSHTLNSRAPRQGWCDWPPQWIMLLPWHALPTQRRNVNYWRRSHGGSNIVIKLYVRREGHVYIIFHPHLVYIIYTISSMPYSFYLFWQLLPRLAADGWQSYGRRRCRRRRATVGWLYAVVPWTLECL